MTLVVRMRIPVWSRLTRPQRALAVVVGVVVVLFVVAAGSGGRGGDANLASPPGFVTWLGRFVGAPHAVDRADLSGSCVPADGLPPDGQVAISGSCTLDVAARDVDRRGLRVTATDPVSVEAPVPRANQTATKDLAAGATLTVSVDSRGAEVTLTCRSASTCSVRVG